MGRGIVNDEVPDKPCMGDEIIPWIILNIISYPK